MQRGRDDHKHIFIDELRPHVERGPELVISHHFSRQGSHAEQLALMADRLRVSEGQTIYNWESGNTKPGATALAGWATARGIGKREALRRLALREG